MTGDDIVAPGWLAAMTQALGQHEFVVGRVEVGTLNTDVRKYGNNGTADKLLNFLPYAIGCNFGVSRRAFRVRRRFLDHVQEEYGYRALVATATGRLFAA